MESPLTELIEQNFTNYVLFFFFSNFFFHYFFPEIRPHPDPVMSFVKRQPDLTVYIFHFQTIEMVCLDARR